MPKVKIESEAGRKVHEYLLIIEPEQIRSKLELYKYEFSKHGFENARMPLSHISLMRVYQHEAFEQRIVKKLRQFAAETRPFEIELDGFGKFEYYHSLLYIQVKTVDPILNIVQRRRKEISPLLKGFREAPADFVSTPHITLARGLKPEQMDQVWDQWKDTPFKSRFTAREMVLLRKSSDGKCRELVRLPFRSEVPRVYVQTELLM